MPRGGGKGGTLLRACSFKLRYTRKNQLSFQNKCFARGKPFGGFYKNDNPYNFCPRAETGKDTKRNAAAKLMRGATGLDCACIKRMSWRFWKKSVSLMMRFMAHVRAYQWMQTVWERMNGMSWTKWGGMEWMSELSVCYLSEDEAYFGSMRGRNGRSAVQSWSDCSLIKN